MAIKLLAIIALILVLTKGKYSINPIYSYSILII